MIAIIDAELAQGKGRVFPNLACMKLAAYYKIMGEDVVLKTDYANLQDYEHICVSKIFTKTIFDERILYLPNVTVGGTGFFNENAPGLPDAIEHCRPDYTLYSDYVRGKIAQGASLSALRHFTDYSIGYLTRGCFRRCAFCVNRKYDQCQAHAPLAEFYDKGRKKIMLFDDNVLAYPHWRRLIAELCDTHKPFTFKQGIDIRLIGIAFIKLIDKAKYDKEIFFAFDDMADSAIIERKLALFRENSNKPVKVYVLCGYDKSGQYNTDFWLNDIASIFKRLEIIGKYRAVPYLTRYERYIESPFSGLYKTISTYCNVGGIFKSASFTDFCRGQLEKAKADGKPCSRWRYYSAFVRQHPSFEANLFIKHYWKGGKMNVQPSYI